MAQKRRPGGGRKPLLTKEGRRPKQVNFRVDPEVLEQLWKEAKQNSRSLTSEIAARLQKSLEEPTAQELAFGDGADRGFAVATVELAHLIRLKFGSWRENWEAFNLFRAAIPHLLNRVAPEGEAKAPEKDIDLLAQAFALAVVANMERAASIRLAEASPRGRKHQKMQSDLQPKYLQPSGGERHLSPEELKSEQAGILAMFLNLTPTEDK